MPLRSVMAGFLALTLLVSSCACAGRAVAEAAAEQGASLDALLSRYLGQYGLPAVGAAVVRDGHVVASGAVGTRRADFEIPVHRNDRFHIGSDTKAMTVLLAGIFVEAGTLRWNTRMEEVFPELLDNMDGDLRRVTLTQLMSHTSGLPGDTEEIVTLINRGMLQPGNLDAQRFWLVKQWAPKLLAAKPGEKWAYSNLGYVILGSILERVGGKTWEELIAARVFDPLQLRTAGFGPQSSLGRVDAPLGHSLIDGKPFAFLAGPNGDNPALLGPAGTVHLSVMDFAAWANWQVGEGRRGPALVSPETMRRMHAKVIDMPLQKDAATGTPGSVQATNAGYALGWGVISLSYSPDPFLFHGGSNGMNYAMILLQPQHDFAMVLMTNIVTPTIDDAFKALGAELYAQFKSRG
jgi:CubicO group peptidase (beta-lactamase class C family)